MSGPGGERFGREYYERTFRLDDDPSPFGSAWWSLAFYARLVRRLLRATGGRRVLEIGCGQGHVLARLTGCEITGVDISEFAIERARVRAPHARCFVADVGEAFPAEVQAGAYDVVLARYVLEHVSDPGRVLQQLFTRLRPGGALLFSVPNTTSPGKRLKGAQWFAYGDPTHISLLDPATWLEHTRAAGFAIRRTFSDGLWDIPYVSHVPRPVQYVLFSLPSVLTVALATPMLPVAWGENLIVIADRPSEVP